ncbi:amino acid adenylation domain-containing protein, partial [Kitasatospora sp. NPDC093806]|uniref:non-ribosomal peptide synthetase n=1 Tax=Kitasatospora sp. NPDC093806 TaxID=3155075 RepID=UPI0034125B06
MESGTKDLRPEEQGGGEGGYQPSFAQHRMWFLDRLAGGRSAEYIASPMWFVHGSLERPELERALERLLGRHAALRTRFVERDGAPHALVAEQSPVRIDWREAADAAEVARQAEEVAGRPFDLATGPLLRIVVWRLSATEHVLLAAVHHIVSDGWSLDVLVRELGALYDGRELPELEWEYADFAERQRRDLDGAALAHGLGYWRERLSGLPALELPTDRPRPTEPSWTGATREFTLAPELVARLEQVGRAHGATLYMTLLAAYQTVLGRWSGQRDFGIGVPVAGRGHSEVEHLIGLFVNTLVMRAELTGDPTFAELLTRVRDHTLDALDHQDVPYERIVRELRPERPDTDSLIDTWFAMQNLPVEDAEADRSPGALRFTDFGTDRPRALFALSLFAQPRADGVAMTFVYRTDLFDAATIDRLVRRCQALLAAVADQPDQPVNTLGLPAEELRELRELGSGDIPAPARDTITQFEDQVRRTPDAVALRTAGTTLTYAELNTRANRLAWWLTDQGVRTEIPVAVRLPRGPEMLIAVLGILKAGGAYVPIDPAWPAERVEHIRTDAGAHLLLDGPLPAADRDDNPQHAVHEQQLAYLIYTSGSTGTPKGVAIPRANLAAHTTRIRRRFALGPTDRVLQFAALAFDASIDQIFPALTCGASLVLPEHGLITPARLITDLHRHGVTLANLPPAYFRELIGALAEHESGAPDSLRLMVLGGDVVRPGEARAWTERYPDVELLNAYGPTEATVTTTLFEITPDSADRPDGIPIGRPLGDRHLHLLDHHLNPAPRGAIAELHIAGTQLARGYHGQPAHTADHFRPDPHGEPGTRIYRTGDLTRWTT